MSRHPLLTAQQVLARIPQQDPFRFIDEILEIDGEHVEATYRWRPDADFYRGHFPGNPVTPGVLLVESMAQASLVALGIYLLAHEQSPDEALKFITVFTDANVEFSGMVRPGDRVRISSKKIFYRRRKLRVEAKMCLADGTLVCSGVISGMGVPK
jgi:3-hydroxyacyl-[acyl-carrier-protein] dehydratase